LIFKCWFAEKPALFEWVFLFLCWFVWGESTCGGVEGEGIPEILEIIPRESRLIPRVRTIIPRVFPAIPVLIFL
jgi:hypothetical protein